VVYTGMNVRGGWWWWNQTTGGSNNMIGPVFASNAYTNQHLFHWQANETL